MRVKVYILLVVVIIIGSSAFGQDLEYFITVNTNFYLPINTPQKGVYPILGYDDDADPKLLIGGFGIGFTAFKSIKDNIAIKGQGNFSKSTYWDEPTFITQDGINGVYVTMGSSDYTVGLAGTVHFFLTDKFSVGTGVGGQFLIVSVSRSAASNFGDYKKTYSNKYYKPIMPVVPIEASLKLKKILFNIRYEIGLMNRLKNDLAQYKSDHYSLLFFEIGFKI